MATPPNQDNYMADFRTGQPGPQDAARKTGIIARVSRAIEALLGKEAIPLADMLPLPNSTEIGASDASYTSFNNPLWRVQYDRKGIYSDLKEMDQNDPVIATALDIHADCCTGFEDTKIDGFEWLMDQKNDAALKILDDLKKRLSLGQEVWHITRGFVQFGEEFREVVVDPDTGVIERFKHLPSYTLSPMLDQYGNKIPGWQQRMEGGSYVKPINFEEWQIIAFVYGARRGWYGTGLMLPARRTWKRLTKLEDGMVLARIMRAYDRYLHRIPVKPDWDDRKQQERIKWYKENMTIRKGLDQEGHLYARNNPLDVPTDFFIPDDGTNRGGIDTLAAQNQQLMNIDDVRYHQELLLSRLKVPRKFLNLTSGRTGALMDGGLEAEDIQFSRTLRQEQAVLRAGLVRLATVALLLQGFSADELGVNVDMPKISTSDMLKDAKIRLADSQAANFFAQALGGLPPELVAEHFMDLSDDEKENLSKFFVEKEAKDEAAAKLDAQMKSKQMDVVRGRPGGVEGDGASPDEAIQSIAKLRTIVQRELEKRHNVKFRVGHSENLRIVRSALEDELLLGRELGL